MIRVAVKLAPRTREQFIDLSARVARQAARQELEAIGEEWVKQVTEIVRNELPRREGRRHKTNTTHLEASFQYRIKEGPNDGFPMRLELTTKPGVNAKKIAALEYGVQGEHVIEAKRTTKPGVNAKKIAALEYGVQGEHVIEAKRTTYLRWGTAPGDLHKPFQQQVTWKPTGRINQGYGFMRRARDRVLARRRAR